MNSQKIKLFVFNSAIILSPLFFNRDTLVLNLYLIFIAQIIAFAIEVYQLSAKEKVSLFSFLSPSFIALFYFLFSFAAGSFTSSRGMGLNQDYIFLPQSMVHIKLITVIVLLLNFLVFQVFKINAQKNFLTIPSVINSTYDKKEIFKISSLVILHLLLFNIGVNFSSIGVSGNFSYPFLFTTSVILFYSITDKKLVVKYIIYGFILMLYTKYNFGSKREILYILMLIIFFELIKRPFLKLTLKQTITFASIGILAFVIIIISSIFRGYGSYEVSGLVDTIKAARNYVGSEIFKNAFVENFELNTSFCNAFNSYELLFNHKIDYQYGLSFLRIFLMPIPTSLIPWKPDRFINIYTEAFNPDFFSMGGSLPTTIYGEAFANLSYLSILFIPFLFFIADSIFYFATTRILNRKLSTLVVLSIFSSITAMQFIRGSGLDLYILYILFSVPYIVLILWLLKLKLKTSTVNKV